MIQLVSIEEKTIMKKLMTLMLGLAFAFATVAPTFAQDTPKKEEKKESKKKKGGKKKEEAPKKDGSH
jgi:hypothetical protein